MLVSIPGRLLCSRKILFYLVHVLKSFRAYDFSFKQEKKILFTVAYHNNMQIKIIILCDICINIVV